MKRIKLNSNRTRCSWFSPLGGVRGGFLLLFIFFFSCKTDLPKSVSLEKMQEIYNEVKTPFKYGLIMVPDSNKYKMDCPTIFRENEKWMMTYIVFDGRGYETWLSESDNLLDWETKGKIMQFTDSTQWDANQKAGYPSLINYNWGESPNINQYNGKYWLSYFGGNSTGYEKGLLSISMAYTENNPTTVHDWIGIGHPVLSSNDEDARWYDNSTMYKSSVIEDHDRLTGHQFVMYYNARGDSINPDRGAERISMAVSNDMVNWKRFGKQPLVNHHKGISGDAVIQKIGDVYVMFFFRANWPNGKTVVYNSFYCSYDLMNWTEWEGSKLIEPSEAYDNLFAHKSHVIKHNGIAYHFYCAVNKDNDRGIAVATSVDLGKSTLQFKAKSETKK